jgi:hypothetical protein
MADGVSIFDGLIIQGNNLISLLNATKIELEAASLDTTAVDSSLSIVNAVLPMAFSEIVKVAGDEKTDYYYSCDACSLACEKKLKFEPPLAVTLTYCDLTGMSGAHFTKYNTIINA